MAEVQSVKNLLKKIQNMNKEMYCILSLVFHCGMEENAMCFAKTGDVTKKKWVFFY